MKTQLLALSLGLVTAASANANLITNGSFETHDAFNGSWNYFDGTSGHTVAGWSSTGGPIEVGTAGTYGVTGQDGQDVMELDSTANVTVSQGVANGGTYTLSFLFAARAGVDPTSDSFSVLWNNVPIYISSSMSTVMASFSTTVTGQAGGNTLLFVGTGHSDSYGALIDDVQLNATPSVSTSVPEPSTWVAGMLLILPFGIHGLRALRMRQQRA